MNQLLRDNTAKAYREIRRLMYKAGVAREYHCKSAKMVGWTLLIATALFIGGCIASRPAHASIVSIAKSQLGQGEDCGNNCGKSVKKYTHGKNVAWCAGFVSWVLNKSGKKVPYVLSAKSYLKIGKTVSNPRMGDIIVFKRKTGGHVGIVEKINGRTITTIEGNVGKYPAKVKRLRYKLNNIPNLIAFVRI